MREKNASYNSNKNKKNTFNHKCTNLYEEKFKTTLKYSKLILIKGYLSYLGKITHHHKDVSSP